MNVGFIGTGSMGSILIESFIRSGALLPENITASNRSHWKAERLAEMYPGLCAAKSNMEVIAESELVMLCVKPGEYKHVIEEISTVVQPTHILVSITSPVLVRHLEELLPCKIAKVIPSITNFACSGATLCVYGSRIGDTDRELLERLFRQVSEPIEIAEDYTRVASDLSSCGPAFLAFFIQQFIHAAVMETGIPKLDAERLASEMTLGTGKLLTSGKFTPDALRERVSVPGGITAEGLRLMEQELHGMFNRLIQTTHKKYREELEKVETMFFSTRVD